MNIRAIIFLQLMLVFAGCNPADEITTFEDSSAALVRLIDGALTAGLNGSPAPTPPDVYELVCVDDELAPTGKVQPEYRYHFPSEALGKDPDGVAFVEAAGNTWKEKGIDVSRADNPGIVRNFGKGRGFTLQVFVNFRTNMVLVSGNGPCVPKPAT